MWKPYCFFFFLTVLEPRWETKKRSLVSLSYRNGISETSGTTMSSVTQEKQHNAIIVTQTIPGGLDRWYRSICRSTHGRLMVDISVEPRSIIGDDSVDVVPLWRSSYRPRWLSVDIDSNTLTLHRHITDTSSIFHRLPAVIIGGYIGQYSIDMFFRHFVLISIDICVHSAPLYRSSYQLMANIITTDSRSIVCRYLISFFHYCII